MNQFDELLKSFMLCHCSCDQNPNVRVTLTQNLLNLQPKQHHNQTKKIQKSKPTLVSHIKSTRNEKVSNTNISDDIAFSILSKLPFKSFKRFEYVCKSWSLLFENHLFMNMFRNNLLSNSYYGGASIVYNVYDESIHEYVFFILFMVRGLRIKSN
jgi:hypothetical protein